VPFQVGRGRDDNEACIWTYPDGDHVLFDNFSETNTCIEAIAYKIRHPAEGDRPSSAAARVKLRAPAVVA
jgi:hypothetical protein